MPRGVEVQLFDDAGVALSSLTDLQVVWLDVPEVKDFADFTGTASAMTTDGTGWLRVDLEGFSGLSVGGVGFLLVYKKNVSDFKDSLIFASEMTVATITSGQSLSVPNDWVRPSDWLTLPTLTTGEQKFVGLLAIRETTNFVALTASGNFVVNWGDGSGDINVNAGVQAERNIAWADVSSSTLTSLGYRQVIVTVTMQAGQTMTSFSLQRKHTQAGLIANPTTNWLDISVNAPSMTTLEIRNGTTVTGLRNLAVARVQENAVTNFSNLFNSCTGLRSLPILTTGSGTNFSGMFSLCTGLQAVPLFDTAAGTNFGSMFNSCGNLRAIPLINTAAGTNFSIMFGSCARLLTVPLLATGAGTNFSNMFTGCANLRAVPLINTAAGTDFNNMFNNCAALRTIPLLNTAAGTDFSNMFGSCFSLQEIPLLNTGAGLNFNNIFSGCQSLQAVPQLNTASGTSFSGPFAGSVSIAKARFNGTTRSIFYPNLALSAEALNDIYTGLGTAAGAQTINVSNNWGVAADDPTIATAKGWTVTG